MRPVPYQINQTTKSTTNTSKLANKNIKNPLKFLRTNSVNVKKITSQELEPLISFVYASLATNEISH